MMAFVGFETVRKKFGKFIYQIQPKIKILVRETWKDPNNRQNVFII